MGEYGTHQDEADDDFASCPNIIEMASFALNHVKHNSKEGNVTYKYFYEKSVSC